MVPRNASPALPSTVRPRRPIARRLVRLTFLVGLPLVLLPAVWPRRVQAKKGGTQSAWAGSIERRAVPRDKTLQDIVDEYRQRLAIPDPVFVSIVPENKLVVSVERLKDRDGAFSLSIEAAFLDELSDAEVQAVIAHELGHVWVFTHHPFLQTEELANEIALRVANRDVLKGVYDKVWKRTGTKGSLQYLPAE